MFETIAILFVFFVLLTFGFIFYTRVQKTTIQSEAEEITVLRAIQVSEKASFLPDIQCSFDNIPVDDCIDAEKITALSSLIDKNIQYYYNIFELSKISVQQVYPNEQTWVMYNNPKKDFSDKTSVQLPVSIYYPYNERYTYGYIDVEVYR